jgi:hypothetical protein
MSSSMSEDYYSFMSHKWDTKHAKQCKIAAVVKSAVSSDTIDFVAEPHIEEPQIEVTESFISDTMIQRMFKRVSAA